MVDDAKAFAKRVESYLGHELSDHRLIETSLTHRSYANEYTGQGMADNERLEFLGDAVLSLVVSELLMERYPEEAEGNLSKYRSAIVNERSLAFAGRGIDLGNYLFLGKGEEMTGGREKDSILSNAYEAVVAAVYLTSGLEDAARFIHVTLREVIENAEVDSIRFDYKTSLQETTQQDLRTTPAYRLVFEGGPDHDKVFESEVEINGRVYGRGQAKSKKDSEQRAAAEALETLKQEFISQSK